MLNTIIENKAPQYRKIWEEICNIESPTAFKEGVDAVGAYITRWAKEKGFQVTSLPQTVSGNPLCITINPDVDAPAISLGCHMDTVHPVGTFGTPAVRVEGDTIYGPGVCDCKGWPASE